MRTTETTIETQWRMGMTKKPKQAFGEIKEAMEKMNGLKHFKRNSPLRILCDASKEGLGAVLQQQTKE